MLSSEHRGVPPPQASIQQNSKGQAFPCPDSPACLETGNFLFRPCVEPLCLVRETGDTFRWIGLDMLRFLGPAVKRPQLECLILIDAVEIGIGALERP